MPTPYASGYEKWTRSRRSVRASQRSVTNLRLSTERSQRLERGLSGIHIPTIHPRIRAWQQISIYSQPLHSPLGGISPPTQVLPRFCCRIGATLEIFDADYAPRWVSIELGVRKRLVRQSNAGIVPGVLRFLQRTSASDDPGPQRGPADGRLAAHVKLPGTHIAAFVDLLQGEPCGIVAGFRRMFRRMCWRVLPSGGCGGGGP